MRRRAAKREGAQPYAAGLIVLVLLLASLAQVTTSIAQTMSDMVGRWYTEVEENQTFGGEAYTIRRQLEVNRPDGTKTVTFRFYNDCRFIGELINHAAWGVSNKVYWMRCSIIEQNGRSVPCNHHQQHDITGTGADFVTYVSQDTGTVYRHKRVDEKFALPTSSCMS